MDKAELVSLTLDKLMDHFRSTPESFEFHSSELGGRSINPTIVWQPKVQLNDSYTVQDPNNVHAIVVTYNGMLNSVTCYVFLKAPPDLLKTGIVADCVMNSQRFFETWRGNYRKFRRLRDMIRKRDLRKENMHYLRKLATIFPDTLDKHLLK